MTPSGSGSTGPRSNRRMLALPGRSCGPDPDRSGSASRPGSAPASPRIRSTGVRQVGGQRRLDRQARRIAKDHSPPDGSSRAGSSIAAFAGSSRMARDIASSRSASERVRIASRRRTGSNSKLNGTCGSSISQEPERPAVRTRVWRTRRCGPLVGKSSGMIENATWPRPASSGRTPPARPPGSDDPVRPLQVIGADGARSSGRNGTS